MMLIKLMKYFISLCYWSRQPVEKVRAMQLRKFKEVFEYAREHSKFYHDLHGHILGGAWDTLKVFQATF